MTPLFLLAFLGSVIPAIPCPDRWALQKIDVWTHREIGTRGQHARSVSLYVLDTHEMIEVTKANVSVLCDGMIKNFRNLKYLTLVEANISRIESGAFQKLPALTHLSLAVNHLSSIERDHFRDLEALRVLYLSKNVIENVDEDAFLDLVGLRKVYLDRNRIHEIDSRWFLSNTQISLIDLSFNNVSKVQKGAFTLPRNSMVEIRLQHNEIEEVEAQAVISSAAEEEEPYLTLRLDYNKLTDITQSFVESMDAFHSSLYFDSNFIKCFAPEMLRSLKNVTVELQADSNPLSCDCVEAATSYMKDHELRAEFHFSSTEDCELPGLKPDNWNHIPQNTYFGN